MTPDAPLIALLIAATALDGLLAGASLDQSIKQLPARRRIGSIAYSAYSQAADLGPGIVWYAALGVGGALLTIAAAVLTFALATPQNRALPIYLAAAAALAHSFTTTRAAPILLRQRRATNDERQLAELFDRFSRWQALRAVLQVTTFGLMLWALAAARQG